MATWKILIRGTIRIIVKIFCVLESPRVSTNCIVTQFMVLASNNEILTFLHEIMWNYAVVYVQATLLAKAWPCVFVGGCLA